MIKNVGQKSEDMGLRLEKTMDGWVGLLISGLHIPIIFIRYPPPPCEMSDDIEVINEFVL